MKKREIVWKSYLLLGVLLSAGCIIYNLWVEAGLQGVWNYIASFGVLVAYLLFLIDLVFELVLFPWGRRRKEMDRPLKKTLAWRLVSKLLFCFFGFYASINTFWSLGILGRGEPEGPYYMFRVLPPYSVDQIDGETVQELLNGYLSLLILPALLFCLVVLFEILVAVRKRRLGGMTHNDGEFF